MMPVADQASRNESAPAGPTFGWSSVPTVTMGLVPHASSLPGWYTGVAHADWPYVIPWMVVFADGVAPYPGNSQVRVKDLLLAYWDTVLRVWVTLYGPTLPAAGQDHNAAFTETYATTGVVDADGELLVSPALGRCAEFWGSRQAFPVESIGGIFVSVSHKLQLLNDSGKHDRWLMQIGADYYPDLGPWSGVNPGVGTGRIKRVKPYWRTTTMLIVDGSFDVQQNPPPAVI